MRLTLQSPDSRREGAGDPPRSSSAKLQLGKALPTLPRGDPRSTCPPTHRTGCTQEPSVLPITGKVWGPIQLSHSHTEHPRGKGGPRTGCTHPARNPCLEPSPWGREAGALWPARAEVLTSGLCGTSCAEWPPPGWPPQLGLLRCHCSPVGGNPQPGTESHPSSSWSLSTELPSAH